MTVFAALTKGEHKRNVSGNIILLSLTPQGGEGRGPLFCPFHYHLFLPTFLIYSPPMEFNLNKF